ncbi:glycosyltransferase [Sphingobacterium sp. JUb56]|uniref:glycosyltransferase n=1 Tax=Sphingobacterium sp. JUb56 TaxID=2587145 RepID=UPI00161AC960
MIDDGYFDRSIEIINTFPDSRIKLYSLKDNVGNYATRNYGVSKVRGKYVAMMDADEIVIA